MTKTCVVGILVSIFGFVPVLAHATWVDFGFLFGVGALVLLAIAVFYWLWETFEDHRAYLVIVVIALGLAAFWYWPRILRWIWGAPISIPVK